MISPFVFNRKSHHVTGNYCSITATYFQMLPIWSLPFTHLVSFSRIYIFFYFLVNGKKILTLLRGTSKIMKKWKENNTNFLENTLAIHKSSQPNCLQLRWKQTTKQQQNNTPPPTKKLQMNNVYHGLLVYNDLVFCKNKVRNKLVTFGREKERKLK